MVAWKHGVWNDDVFAICWCWCWCWCWRWRYVGYIFCGSWPIFRPLDQPWRGPVPQPKVAQPQERSVFALLDTQPFSVATSTVAQEVFAHARHRQASQPHRHPPHREAPQPHRHTHLKPRMHISNSDAFSFVHTSSTAMAQQSPFWFSGGGMSDLLLLFCPL